MGLRIFSAGATRGLVDATLSVGKPESVESTFGAVGAIADKLLNGAKADIAILTKEAIAKLAEKGIVDPSSTVRLGVVRAGFALRGGDSVPPLATGEDLREALLSADAIYLPDPERATSGIHFAKVLEKLEIRDEVWPRLRIYPLGGEAMRELLSSDAERPLGFTQASEILEIADVVLAGLLPEEFELATVYEAAVASGTTERRAAERFVQLLSGEETASIREKAGFTRT